MVVDVARERGRASQSARLASSAFFLFWTYFTYESISGANSVVGLLNLIVELTIWGIGGVAIYQLWLPESSLFLRSGGARAR